MTVPPLLSQFSCTKAFFACIHLFMWCIIIITLTVWYLLVNFLLPVQGSCSLKTDSKVEYTSTLNHKPNQLFFSVYNNGKQAAVIFTYEILFHAENSNSESIEWAWNLTKTRFIIRWSQEQYKIYFRISIPHLSVYITCHLLGKMTVHTGSRNCHELRLIVSTCRCCFRVVVFLNYPAIFPAIDIHQLLFSYWFKILRKLVFLLCLQISVAS